MTTIAEADTFLCERLKFENWKEVLKCDKLDFLNLLVRYFAHNIYFQNITLSSIPEALRKVPDVNDIIQAGLSAEGGNCITQNGFLCILLKVLGFDSFNVAGMVNSAAPELNNHVLCVVRLNQEELYLLDLGVGLPFPEPIPLHKLPFIHRALGYRMMYRKSVDNLYECIQLDGSLMGEIYENENTEYMRYNFTLIPRTIDFFKESLTSIFTDPVKSIFLQCPFLFRYFNENDNGILLDEPQLSGDRKFILIRGDAVLIGTNETKLLKKVTSYESMRDIIFKYFPMLSKENVEESLKMFKF